MLHEGAGAKTMHGSPSSAPCGLTPVPGQVAGVPYWMPAKSSALGTSSRACASESQGAEPRCSGDTGTFSIWQAIWSPSEISRDTVQQQGAACGSECRGRHMVGSCSVEPELMDLVLFPLAFLPGRLGAVTRARVMYRCASACVSVSRVRVPMSGTCAASHAQAHTDAYTHPRMHSAAPGPRNT